jgi:hypothetical protein
MKPNEFADPGAAYRGVALWMLNDKLEKDEIARQFRELHAAGWGAVIGRTFNGLRTEYLSEEWMEFTHEIVDLCGELGMKLWLQAGYMPSGIPDLRTEDQHRVLVRKPRAETSTMTEALLCEDEDHAYYEARMAHVLDLLNAESCAAYLASAYEEPWAGRFGDQFGKAVEAVWVDEPHFRPPLLPWTQRLPAAFKAEWEYSVLDNIPSLFAPVGDYQKVRHHYWRTVLGLFLHSYFKQVGQWCEEHGLKFSGHLMGEDTLVRQVSWTASCMPCYEYMQLPGIDHLTRSLKWPADKSFILPPKQCSSAANQLSRPEVLAEMYGVSSQGFTFEDRKLVATWLAMLGINYRCYHGAFYSMRGRRKRIYAPHLSYQQPWWPENRIVADYFARLSYVLRRGSYRADVLVVHPIESAFCLYDCTRSTDTLDASQDQADMTALEDSVIGLSENLLRTHRGFDYADELLMAKHGSVSDTGITVGPMTYKAVVLPSLLTLRSSTIELLTEFMESGGAVLSVGGLPTRIDGVEDAAIEEFNRAVRKVDADPQALRQVLDEVAPSDVELVATEGDAGHLWLHERRLDGERMFIVANVTPAETIEAELKVGVAGGFEHWNLEDGAIGTVGDHRQGTTSVKLTLPPVAARLLVFREGKSAAGHHLIRHKTNRKVTLNRRCVVTRSSPNALTLDTCRYRKEGGEWSEPMPVLAVHETLVREDYEGPVALKFAFTADAVPAAAQIVVEDAAEHEIRVNGRPVAHAEMPYYFDRSFHPVDVTEHLRVGENEIEVSRRFQPPPQAKFMLGSLFQTASGTELEAVYLTGDFAVRSRTSPRPARPLCTRLEPEFVVTGEPGTTTGDLTSDGYPFFAGRLALTATAELEAAADGESAFLVLPCVGSVLAKVRVNGNEAGSIAWAPYEVEITSLIEPGENRIEIEFVTSLRNLLGPHHHPDGEPDDSRDHYFCNRRPRSDWFERTEEERGRWTDDYFVMPFGFSEEPVVEYRAAD